MLAPGDGHGNRHVSGFSPPFAHHHVGSPRHPRMDCILAKEQIERRGVSIGRHAPDGVAGIIERRSVVVVSCLHHLQSAACCVKRIEQQLLIKGFSQAGHGIRLRRPLLPLRVILSGYENDRIFRLG